MSSRLPLRIDDVRAAAQRLRDVAERTPVLQVREFNDLAGNALFLKCENLQRGGAFKFRGAYNRLAQLSDEERRRGVVAFSSGNHAQGVALAAKLLGIQATIVMPADAPQTKLEATRGYGARVVCYDRNTEDREKIAAEICRQNNATLVPPYDDYRIMAGQGTAALELMEQIPDLDALLVPLGGGGLLSGCAVAAKAQRSAIQIYGVEPEAGNDWQLSWQRGKPQSIESADTIADGLRVTSPGTLTWPIVRELADGILTVSDDEIRKAMQLLLERGKLVVEPSGAAALAAALFQKAPLRGKHMGVVLSGGNVDLDRLCSLTRR